MTRHDQRMVRLVEAMSPEETARWFIEAPILGQAVSPAEQKRYRAYCRRFERLRPNLRVLMDRLTDVQTRLLERDRILWYHRALRDVTDLLAFGAAGEALLVRNPNMKPGKPLELRTVFG